MDASICAACSFHCYLCTEHSKEGSLDLILNALAVLLALPSLPRAAIVG
jgi:hypothetical protein